MGRIIKCNPPRRAKSKFWQNRPKGRFFVGPGKGSLGLRPSVDLEKPFEFWLKRAKNGENRSIFKIDLTVCQID